MIENNSTDVFAAFEMLLEEIEAEIELINKTVNRAMERRDYDGARQALDYAAQATTFRDKIVSLREEWGTLAVARRDKAGGAVRSARRNNLGRLPRGVRTPEKAFRQPILKALMELGGSARVEDVLEKVEQSMKNVLREVDYERLASGVEMHRWRNTAQWARDAMVKEGLLKANSPRGIWEITEAGRLSLIEGAN